MTAPFLVIWAGIACTAIAIGWMLYMHSRERLDLTDVLTEFDDVRGVRRASIRKVGEAVALGASTFGVTLLTVSVAEVVYSGKDPGGLMLGAIAILWGLYLGAWVSRTLLGMLAGAKANMMNASAGPPK